MIKGILIIVKKLPASGMALFPFILIRRSSLPAGDRLMNHERIHLQQQIELLIFPFYLWYLAEYFFYRIKLQDHNLAYRAIRFEKEAYANDHDLNYLQKRKRYNYI